MKSGLLTTCIQVASRLLLVWAIDLPFPQITAHSAAFLSMAVAWSVTEILRYGYYAANLGKSVPEWLVWARYSLFFVLYPLGAGSEWLLIWKSVAPSQTLSPVYAFFLRAILAVYIPGFYFLYTYMIAQRRKVLKRRGKRAIN